MIRPTQRPGLAVVAALMVTALGAGCTQGMLASNTPDVTSRYTARAETVLSVEQVKRRLAGASDLADLLMTLEKQDERIAIGQFEEIKAVLWQTYADETRGNPRRRQEQAQEAIRYNGKTMHYVSKRVGERPTRGYPLYIALHGGGGAPARVNDSQWKHMQEYYFAGMTNGIYLAPRGVNDAWNLHWVDESFACYDRLIENMIAFGQVDPNRIYLMGYSAGGDAAYQVPARAPDRWAAVAMSAGHPNGVSPDNYASLAFLIQVGERDAAYQRNQVAAAYGVKLDRLAAANPGLYEHDTFIHVGRPHGFMDRAPYGQPQRVYADAAAWLAQGSAAATTNRNCNSIHWLRDHVRDPLPRKLIWDAKTAAKRSGAQEQGFWPTTEKGRLHYWLGLDRYDKDVELERGRLVVELDAAANAIRVAEIGNYVRFYLSPAMLDLSRAVTVHVEGQSVTATPTATLGVMVRSLLDRGDPSYLFPVCLMLSKNPEGRWLLE